MNISLIHASRSRATQAEEAASRWLSFADRPNEIEYILCLDTSDPKGIEYAKYFSDKRFTKCIRDNKSAIQAFNEGGKIASGDLIIALSDDFLPTKSWDTILKKALKDQQFYCVKTNDGIQPFIITLPIFDRKWYERFGYVYESSYSHMYVDSEMSCVAWMMDKYVKVDIDLIHEHYSTGNREKDGVNAKADRSYKSGKENFINRHKKNFGLKPEEIKQELPEWSGFKNLK